MGSFLCLSPCSPLPEGKPASIGITENCALTHYKMKMISNVLVVTFAFSSANSNHFIPTCSNSADYTSWGGGIRTVSLPASACLQTPNWEESGLAERIHRLCCANSHVVCEEGRTQAELTSYDGGVFQLSGDEPNTWLNDAFARICAMPMARRYGDCKALVCVGTRRAGSVFLTN